MIAPLNIFTAIIAQQAMMAGAPPPPSSGITYVGGKTAGSAGSAPTFDFTGLTGGSDSTPQAGDVYILSVGTGQNSAGLNGMTTPPVGLIGTTYNEFIGDIIDLGFTQWYGIATSATATDSFTIDPNGKTNWTMLAMTVWRGVDQVTPLDVATPAPFTSNNNNSPSNVNITPVTDGALMLAHWGISDANGNDITPDPVTGWTTRHNYRQSDRAQMVATRTWNTGDGTINPGQVFTGGAAGFSCGGGGVIALRPA